MFQIIILCVPVSRDILEIHNLVVSSLNVRAIQSVWTTKLALTLIVSIHVQSTILVQFLQFVMAPITRQRVNVRLDKKEILSLDVKEPNATLTLTVNTIKRAKINIASIHAEKEILVLAMQFVSFQTMMQNVDVQNQCQSEIHTHSVKLQQEIQNQTAEMTVIAHQKWHVLTAHAKIHAQSFLRALVLPIVKYSTLYLCGQ